MINNTTDVDMKPANKDLYDAANTSKIDSSQDIKTNLTSEKGVCDQTARIQSQ